MSEHPHDATASPADDEAGGDAPPAPDTDYRARPRADDIPCPFLTTAYNNGALVPDEDGTLDAPRIDDAMRRYGISKRLRGRLAGVVVKADEDDSDTTLNLFELRGSGLDHTGSSGIRDPKVDPSKVALMLSFGEDGRMYREHFAKAANHFAKLDPGVAGTVQQTVDMAALLRVFGRKDDKGALYMTARDIEDVWVHGRHPEGWVPPEEDSIGMEILGEAGMMHAERVIARIRGKF